MPSVLHYYRVAGTFRLGACVGTRLRPAPFHHPSEVSSNITALAGTPASVIAGLMAFRACVCGQVVPVRRRDACRVQPGEAARWPACAGWGCGGVWFIAGRGGNRSDLMGVTR